MNIIERIQFFVFLTLFCQFLLVLGNGKGDFLVPSLATRTGVKAVVGRNGGGIPYSTNQRENSESVIKNVVLSDSPVIPVTKSVSPRRRITKKTHDLVNDNKTSSVKIDEKKQTFVEQSPLKGLTDFILNSVQQHREAFQPRTGLLMFGMLSMLEAATLATVAMTGVGGVLFAPLALAGIVLMVYAL